METLGGDEEAARLRADVASAFQGRKVRVFEEGSEDEDDDDVAAASPPIR